MVCHLVKYSSLMRGQVSLGQTQQTHVHEAIKWLTQKKEDDCKSMSLENSLVKHCTSVCY